MTTDDLFRAERLGAVALAPDRGTIAVVVQRAWGPRENPAWTFLSGNGRGDIWLEPAVGGGRRRITDGREDGAGYWMPVWSPDGRRLAMLSTRGGDNVRLMIWSRGDDSVHELAPDGVDLFAETRAEVRGLWQPAVWVDDTTLLCAFVANGGRSELLDPDVRMQRAAPVFWRTQEAGTVPTASALYTGATGRQERARDAADSASAPGGYVALVDARTGRITRLAEYPVIGETRRFALSPRRTAGERLLAIGVASDVRAPEAGEPLANARWARTRLGIVKLGEPGRVHWIDTIEVDQDLYSVPLRWSSDGSRLAVVGRLATEHRPTERAFIVTSPSFAVRVVTPSELDVDDADWADARSLLVRARATEGCRNVVAHPECARRDWWIVDGRSARVPRNLTRGFDGEPQAVLPVQSGRALVAVADGALWLLRGTSTIRLLGDGSASVTRLLWPTRVSERADTSGQLLVAVAGETQNVQRLDLGTSAAVPVRTPAREPRIRIADYDATSGRIFAASSDDLGYPLAEDGPALWLLEPGELPVPLLTLNEGLARVADAPRRIVRYRGLDGDSLRALLVLPVGYAPGQRYPLVTWVYPGTMISDTLWPTANKNLGEVPQFNLQMLAAHGYAVLVPSVPVTGPGRVDAFLDVPKGVLPAIDRVVELGIADNARVAVMGHSMGGYAALGLIGYTHRFAAAITAAGPTDLTSSYGTFDRRFVYQSDVHMRMTGARLQESGPMLRLGMPWDDSWRFRLNSPLSYVQRVQTPVMIVQGDADYIAITQGEEFFTALRRLGKTAEFVRYWGEGHILHSPANVRDWWSRVYAFLDRYIGKSGMAADPGRE